MSLFTKEQEQSFAEAEAADRTAANERRTALASVQNDALVAMRKAFDTLDAVCKATDADACVQATRALNAHLDEVRNIVATAVVHIEP